MSDGKNLVIGLDGDKIKSGIAIYNKETNKIEFKSMAFFEVYAYLLSNKENIKQVKIEAAFLIAKSNWHNSKSVGIASKIGKNVGENHQTSRLLCEMCEFLGIDYLQKKPLLKRWGKSGKEKINHEEIVKLLKPLKIEVGNKTNGDVRDAILICLF